MEVVKELLAADGAGVCLRARTVGGYTPAMLAQNTEIESMLLQAVACCSARSVVSTTQVSQSGARPSRSSNIRRAFAGDSYIDEAGVKAACFRGWVILMDTLYLYIWGNQ
eukprot:SAG31_NODE_3958_length_3718_cov_1.698259_1_plen_110_part_00